jgi:hypothetical protein
MSEKGKAGKEGISQHRQAQRTGSSETIPDATEETATKRPTQEKAALNN